MRNSLVSRVLTISLFLLCSAFGYGSEAPAANEASGHSQLSQLLDTSDFPERWHCGNWSGFHGWTHIISDLVVWLAYTSIPIALLIIVRRKRSVLPYPFLWVMFSLFIISCGLTHLMESIIFWWPAYRLLGLLKVITALISAATALLLLPKLGQILSLKTPEAAEREIKDATDRAEEAKNAELAKHFEILESILEDSFAGYWDWNIATGEVWWSPRFYELLGYKKGEIPATYEALSESLLHPEFQEPMKEAINAHLTQSAPFRMDVKMRCKTGEYRWFDSFGVSSLDANGQPTRMVGSITDISLRKDQEAKDKKSIFMLSEQNKRLVSFAHIISHNLRSSTGNMIALLSMLDIETDLTEREHAMGHIQKCATKLHGTVEHLTEVVKIQTELNHKLEPVRFEDLLDSVKKLLAEEIIETKTTVIEDFSQLEEIDYVSSYLESIFLNLLSNAIRYRDPSRDPRITVRSEIVNGQKRLHFEDNGLGIDLERNGPKVFGLYKTFHSNPDARGVGLFFVKNQIEALNGQITIQSQPGLGTTFTITF